MLCFDEGKWLEKQFSKQEVVYADIAKQYIVYFTNSLENDTLENVNKHLCPENK